MIRKTLLTTLRTAADVCTRPSKDDLPRLFPSACLRMVDHHLHKSGILQGQVSSDDHRSRTIYDHAWLCASQSIQVNAYADLLGLEHVTSHVWINRVGKTSVQLGNALTVSTNDSQATVLAVAQRIFVRKKWNGQSAPFSDYESTRYRDECGPTPAQEKFDEELPTLQKLDITSPKTDWSATEPVWTVPVGISNTNFGGHADHAFLAETAYHALRRQGDYMALNYLAEVSVKDILRCYNVVHENDTDDFVIVTRTPSHNPDDTIPILLAKGAT